MPPRENTQKDHPLIEQRAEIVFEQRLEKITCCMMILACFCSDYSFFDEDYVVFLSTKYILEISKV